MKKFYVTTVIAGAMIFSLESATAQETQNAQSQTATEQTQQKENFRQIDVQELPDEVRQTVERDYEEATVTEAYSRGKDEETMYKIVVTTQDGQSQEVYADAQGNWIAEKRDNK